MAIPQDVCGWSSIQNIYAHLKIESAIILPHTRCECTSNQYLIDNVRIRYDRCGSTACAVDKNCGKMNKFRIFSVEFVFCIGGTRHSIVSTALEHSMSWNNLKFPSRMLLCKCIHVMCAYNFPMLKIDTKSVFRSSNALTFVYRCENNINHIDPLAGNSCCIVLLSPSHTVAWLRLVFG